MSLAKNFGKQHALNDIWTFSYDYWYELARNMQEKCWTDKLIIIMGFPQCRFQTKVLFGSELNLKNPISAQLHTDQTIIHNAVLFCVVLLNTLGFNQHSSKCFWNQEGGKKEMHQNKTQNFIIIRGESIFLDLYVCTRGSRAFGALTSGFKK